MDAVKFLPKWMPKLNKGYEPPKMPEITIGSFSPEWQVLVDDFQTADWIKLIPYPELTIEEVDRLLTFV